MIALIKHSQGCYISYLYLIINKEVILGGMIERYALKKMIEQKAVSVIEKTEVIEKFWFSSQITDEVKTSEYYYLGS